ncbi:TetR/AcrR family transcriptional regulator [Cellulomonas xylanilytica]|uniref:TetR family transcriptional regulator n=1 Tax=Cellulomonas xylanilytica TaxID=233583 RepID=A0A510VB05_9CELL|nr:TetR family transcriptional regulator [Cellulomonas xylanilytica]GEK22440.1 TetR family transcriptional regulator [Cellulomonas xylanilytica]
MNVRSEDLTARARIRDAAVARFGRDGFRAPVRAIAEDAGVSAALVIHHFGSKDALRAECDQHVLTVIREQKSNAIAHASPAETIGMLATVQEYAPLFAYLVRSLLDGGALAGHFVDGLVDDASAYLQAGEEAGTVRPSADPAGRARQVVATQVGLLVMAQLDAAAGHGVAPTESPAEAIVQLYERSMLAGLELYTYGLLTDSRYLDAYQHFRQDKEKP